jgi:hypothetical protein
MTGCIAVMVPPTVLESFTIITTTDAGYLVQKNYKKQE